MTTISTLPDAPNPLTDSQAQFNSKALAFTEALPTLVTEINTVAGEINTAKTAAETAETNAETAETNAEAAQTAAEAAVAQAQATADVTKWISGTNYTEGDCVWSPATFLTYRRRVTGGGTTDPSADATNWLVITSNGRPAWQTKTTTYTAAAGEAIMADTSGGAWTLTLPATPSANDVVYVADYAGTFATNNLTVARNALKIMGLSEDMTVSDNNAAFTLTYIDATEGWRLT